METVKITQSKEEFARLIDHTLLKPDTTMAEIDRLCEEATLYGFYSVCVPPCHVSQAKRILKNTTVKVCSVVGFPLGYTLPQVKLFETKSLIDLGADEIDMVANVSWLKSGETNRALDEVFSVVKEARGAPVKVIIETCLLNDEDKRIACELIKKAGASFVKTSTGFAAQGATAKDVTLLRELVGPQFGVKASGGIRDLKSALSMVKAGANRIGTGASVEIVNALSPP